MHLRSQLRVLSVVLGLVAVPLCAEVQQTRKIPAIGYLSAQSASVTLPIRTAFREGTLTPPGFATQPSDRRHSELVHRRRGTASQNLTRRVFMAKSFSVPMMGDLI